MIALVHHPAATRAASLAKQIEKQLAQLGRQTVVVENSQDRAGSLPEHTSLILSLGGDGTILGAVRLWARQGMDNQVPIIGINLGGLGFLASLTPQELNAALEKIVSNTLPTQLRTLLEVEVEGRDNSYCVALNDSVVSKHLLSSLLELEVLADQEHLVSMRADGIIVATPTGSSAYNLSAGGPICHPELDCLIITPICSFNFSNRPLILPPHMELSIKVLSNPAQAALMCDGQVGFDLQCGDTVRVRRAKAQARLGTVHNYFEILRSKLKWG